MHSDATAGQDDAAAGVWKAVLGWAGVLVVLWVLALARVRSHSIGEVVPALDRLDAGMHVHIAKDGYIYQPGVHENVGWFPGFMATVRAVHAVYGGDWAESGVRASIAAGAALAATFWLWLGTIGQRGGARSLAVAVLLLYPFGIYLYGIPYSDTLFVALALAAFVLVERGHPGWAAVAAVAATATRLSGIVLVAALVVRQLELGGVLAVGDAPGRLARRVALPTRWLGGRLRPAHLLPLAGLAGIGGFFAYCWARFDDPFVYFTVQDSIVSSASPLHPRSWPPLLLLHFVFSGTEFADGTRIATVAIQGVLVVLATLAVPAVCRRYGFAYGVYTAGLLAMIWVGSWDFASAGRYLLAGFPLAALLGANLAGRRVAAPLVLAGMAAGMAFLFLAFVDGHPYMT